MATYLHGVTDYIPQIQPFQPDFGMIQKVLSARQSRYDQGFSALSSTYNQVLNAPLSDSTNRAIRNIFINQAETKLKDLSKVDLSLPDNLANAEKIFSPFWEDEMILQDTNLTKWYNNEISKAFTTRDSQDEKVRGQYNDAAVMYLQNGLEKLQNANRNSDNYSKLEKRRFVPFQNLEAYLDEQAKLTDFKIESTNSNGAYLISTTNGARSIPGFETFAHNMLGNNFREQFHVLGTVEKEERIRQIKRDNPLLSDKAALEIMSKDVMTELKEGMTSKQDSLNIDRKKVNDKIKDYEKWAVLNDNQKVAYVELLKQSEQLDAHLSSSKDELDGIKKDETKTKQQIVDNPDGYFSSIMKQRTVKGWANARAQNESTKIQEDPIWKENSLNIYRNAQLDIDRQRVNIDQKRYELEKWKAENKDEEYNSSGGNSHKGKNNTNQDPEKAGHYDGLGSTDVTHVGNAWQVFQERQQQRLNYANNQIFNVVTGIGNVLSRLDVNDEDAVKYMDMMKEMSVDPDNKFDIKDVLFFKEIGSKLQKETGLDATSGFDTARSALFEIARKGLTEKLKQGGVGFSKEDFEMLVSYVSGKQALEEFSALDKQSKDIFQQTLRSDSDLNKYVVTREDGSADFAGAKEIAPLFKKPVYYFTNGQHYTREELAKYFVEGRLSGGRKDQGNIDIDGISYIESPNETASGFLPGVFGALRNKYDGRANLDLLEIQKKYGKSKEYFDVRQSVNNKVVPNLEEYKNETGKMGFAVRYDLSDKTTGDIGARLLNEAAQASNREGIYVNGILSDKNSLNNAVLNIAGMGEDELEKYVSTTLLKTSGANGRPSLEVKFKPMKTSDKTEIDGFPVADLAGKTIEIDLNPNPTGETLQKIRINSGYNIYGALSRGISIKSDPMMEAAGFSFQVTPDSTKHPSSAIVKIMKKEFKEGQYVDSPVIRELIPFMKKGPDEIVSFMYSLFLKNMTENLSAQTLYQQKNKNKLLSPQQIRDDFYNNKEL